VLSEEGCEVSHAAWGDSGLQIARDQTHDVVITELKLPEIDGLVRELRKVRLKLPVILMTARGTTETAIEATKFGAYDYLLKPFEMDELLDLTARAVAQSWGTGHTPPSINQAAA
jgi:DNA-binding response OmpR family regulator